MSDNTRDPAEIDVDAVKRFIDENPLHLSPEALLESAIEVAEAYPEDWHLVAEATRILDDWERQASIGEPLAPELKRFLAESFFTRHGFAGAEGHGASPKYQS